MKREDIEKAAEECRRTTAQSMGVYGQYHSIDECPEHGLSCDELVEGSFTKGAEWRINSVWHDINKEKPQDEKQCLLEITYKNGYVPYYHLTKWYEMNEFVFHDRCAKVRWAYIEDLIPNKED